MAARDHGREARERGRADFSPSEAAFTGWNLLTREPRTWLIWSALFLIFSLGLGVLMVTTAGPALMQMTAAPTATPDPTASLALMGRLAPFYALMLIATIVFYAVAFAAVNRAVLRPGAAGFAHLALGCDELRQFIVLILLGLVLLAVYFVALIVGALVGGVAGVAVTHGGVGAGATSGPMVLVFVLVALFVFGATAFVMTRLSLAMPIAFDTGRIDLGASWRLTRGRFWGLFGAYVLVWLLAVVIFILVGVPFALIVFATSGGMSGLTTLMRPDMSSLAAYFAPLQLLWAVVNAALAPLLFALALGAPAGAYAQLRGGEGGAVVPGSDLPRFGR